ncbi:InlB B-repeat-containing protein [Spirochaeta dissipatitropha]
MYKSRYKTTLLCMLVVFSLLCFSCSNPFFQPAEDYSSLKGGQDQPKGLPADATDLQFGSLSINRQDGRTVLPAPVLPDELEYMVSLVSHNGHAGIEAGPFEYSTDGFFIDEIPVGTWDVHVSARRVGGSQTMFTGSALGVFIQAGGSNSIHLSLKPTQDGTGSFEFSLGWPAALVDQYTIEWRTERGGEPLDEVSWPFTALPNEIDNSIVLNLEAEELESGSYFLRIGLKNSADVLVASVSEIVVIYDDQVSTKNIILEEKHISQPPTTGELFPVESVRNAETRELTGIKLSWTRGSYTESGYRIYREINTGGMVLMDDSLPGFADSWTDTELSALESGDTLVYRITAFNSFGDAPGADSPETTLHSFSWNDNGATQGAGDLPESILLFSGETLTVPGSSAGMRGPLLTGEHDGSGITQRFLGWSVDGGDPVLAEEINVSITEDTVCTAVWTTDEDAIVKVGPAGGTIFYDKGNDVDGWRYMEVATYEHETAGRWQQPMELVGETSGNFGAGKFNTSRIVAWVNAEGGRTAQAATDCYDLAILSNTILYDDWFLPSNNELQEIYAALNGTIAFDFSLTYPGYWYYSSTEYNADHVGDLNFSTGIFTAGGNKSDADKSIRPIRAFRSTEPTYIVTYDLNGDDGIHIPFDGNYYESGDTVYVTPETMVRQGYIFLGWATEPDNPVEIYDAEQELIMPAGNLVLYAQWEMQILTFIQTSELNGAAEFNLSRSDANAHTSLGYYLGGGIAPYFVVSVNVPENEGIGFTSVRLMDNGNWTNESIQFWAYRNGEEVAYEEYVGVIPFAVDSMGLYYRFDDFGFGYADTLIISAPQSGGEPTRFWLTDVVTTIGGVDFDDPDLLTGLGSPIVTAVPSDYRVRYFPNRATDGSVPIDPNLYGYYESATILAAGSLVRSGYNFTGWNTLPDGSGDDYAANMSKFIEDSFIRLYAQWEAPHITGDLTAYNGQTGYDHFLTVTGSVSGDTVWGSHIYTSNSSLPMAAVHAGLLEEGQDATVKVRMLETSDYMYLASDRNGVMTVAHGPYSDAYQVTGLNSVYPPYFMINDGPEYQVTIATATPNATIRYTIDGGDPAGGTVYSGPVTISSLTEAIELRAQVSASGLNPLEREIFLYPLNFNSYGGTELDPWYVLNGQQISVDSLPAPEREGYNFAGWYASENFGGSSLYGDFTVFGLVTLHAKWEWIPDYYLIPDSKNQLIINKGQADIDLSTLVPAISGDFWMPGNEATDFFPVDIVQDSLGNFFVSVSTILDPASTDNRGFADYGQSLILKIPNGNPAEASIVFPSGSNYTPEDLPDILCLTIDSDNDILYFFAAEPTGEGANGQLWSLNTGTGLAVAAQREGGGEYHLYGDNLIKMAPPGGMTFVHEGVSQYLFVVTHHEGTRLEKIDISDFSTVVSIDFIARNDANVPAKITFFDVHYLDGQVYVTAPVWDNQTMYYASSEAPKIIRFNTDLTLDDSIGMSAHHGSPGLVPLYYPQRFVNTEMNDALYFLDGGGRFFGQDTSELAQHPALFKRLVFKVGEDDEFDSYELGETKAFWGYYLHFSCGL